MSLVRLESTPSTQDEVHRLAEAGAPSGTAVLARRQGQGRGSRGRSWSSPEGGMWLSVLWRGDARGAQLVGIRTGLAVAMLLEEAGLAPRLKWPNDILIEDLKVGGILCEGRWQGERAGWVAIGIGLNVRNDPPQDARRPAASLKRWCTDLDPGVLAGILAPRLAALDSRATLTDDELSHWAARDWLAGRTVRGPVAGMVQGIGPSGRAIVLGPDGRRHELVAGDGLEL